MAMRYAFEQELSRLEDSVIELGQAVEEALAVSVRALAEEDEAPAARLEAGADRRYKRAGARIVQECMILQARQAPVARDLRMIYSVREITEHLVRSGTLCEHVNRMVAGLNKPELDEDLRSSLFEAASASHEVFAEGLRAFENRDAERAMDLMIVDDKVDQLYTKVIRIATASVSASPSPDRARSALIAHYLERIADHGVSIAGRTAFLITGKRVTSARQSHPGLE